MREARPATRAMLRLRNSARTLRAAEAGITLEFGTKKKPPPQKAKAVEKREEEKPPPQAPPPPPFVSRGWLMKKGRKRRNWKRRYFVLSDDWSSISYYEDERCLKERGRVNLGGARCDLGLDYVPKRAHVFAFTVRARDDVYHLECSSEGERQRWLRTLKTASTSARDDARAEVEEERRQARRAEAGEMSDEAAAFLSSLSVDGLLGDAGLFHRHNWLRTLNNVLSSEKTLAQMNKALRGIYVVEAMTLRYEGDDKLSVKRLELRPDQDAHRFWSRPEMAPALGVSGQGLPPGRRRPAFISQNSGALTEGNRQVRDAPVVVRPALYVIRTAALRAPPEIIDNGAVSPVIKGGIDTPPKHHPGEGPIRASTRTPTSPC